MPTDRTKWKQMDVPTDLHRELERAAKIAHLSTQGYAAYLLTRGLREDAALAEIPFRERRLTVPAIALRPDPTTCQHRWWNPDFPTTTCIDCGIQKDQAR